jgi:hypothetical protein
LRRGAAGELAAFLARLGSAADYGDERRTRLEKALSAIEAA